MNHRKRWLLLSIALFIAVIVLLGLLEDTADIQTKESTKVLPKVSVVSVEAQDHAGVIVVPAEITPRWNTALRSQVSGQVLEVSSLALEGSEIKQGEWLVKLENSAYRALVAEAEQVLAAARLEMLQAQKKADQAARDWERAGIQEAPSDLMLNKPQLRLAQKSVKAAKHRLAAAKKSLEHSTIAAPFDAMVTARHVNLGQSIMEGEELFELIDAKTQELRVSLSQEQWQKLSLDWTLPSAVFDMNGRALAQAFIQRASPFVDAETRQHRVYLEIDQKPETHALAGEFVQVHLPGTTAARSLDVPESALTREGIVWYVDNDERLRFFTGEVLFHHGDRIIIAQPDKSSLGEHYPSQWRIATTPLASFLSGYEVEPIEARRD